MEFTQSDRTRKSIISCPRFPQIGCNSSDNWSASNSASSAGARPDCSARRKILRQEQGWKRSYRVFCFVAWDWLGCPGDWL